MSSPSTSVFAMDIPTIVLTLLFIYLWCFFYWRPRRKIWAAARLIPGPKALPLIGNAMLFWDNVSQTLPSLLKLYTEYGSIVRLWVGDQLLVLLSDPEDIKSVLANPRIVNRDRNMSLAIMPFFGNGLLANADEDWKVHRKLMTPMFHYKVLETYLGIFGTKAKILADKLDEVADGRPFDVNKRLSLCALDAISETVDGSSKNSQEVGYSGFRDVLYNATKLVHRRVVYPWLLIPWLYPLTSDGRKAKEVIKGIDTFNNDMISRNLDTYRQGDRRPGDSFLDMLIEATEVQGSSLTEKDVKDEVTTMTTAGFSTSSVTMSTVLLLIAVHPEWQDALFAEMSDVFADDMTRPVTSQDLVKMPVLDRVIRETLRMYPVVALIPRMITEDIALSSGYTLPAGSSTLIVNYRVHRNARDYPEPDKFLPDRWLPGAGSGKHPFAYLPFGAGTRNCIGQKYALLQMKSTISHLVRRFKMATDLTGEDLEKLEMSFMLRLRSGGYQLKLEKRVAYGGALS